MNGTFFTGGSVDGIAINPASTGGTTPGPGAFTTLTANAAITFTANTASTSTSTGTLVVTGGAGFSGALFSAGLSVSKSSGAIKLEIGGQDTFEVSDASSPGDSFVFLRKWAMGGLFGATGCNGADIILSSGQLKWAPGNWTGSADVGLIRSAAGNLKVTNGSSGIGTLIFKLPTSDPGISGSLWNNSGTITISP